MLSTILNRLALISGFRLSVCFSRLADGLKRCASLDDPSLSANAQLILLPDSSSCSAEECCTQRMAR
ncbi:hypothetical protein HKD37_09G025019 [Glycine soja]